MAKNNNLTDFLTDVANTIRAKKGTQQPIDPQNFSDEIATISTSKPEGPLNVTPTTVAQTIYPSEGEVFNVVNVSAVTSVIDSNIQASNIKSGVSILGVSGTLPTAVLYSTSTILTNPTQTFTPDPGYDGFSAITLTAPLISSTVSPSTTAQTVTPTGTGCLGFSVVNVDAVTSAIDNNIQASNIKKDVTILGVTGTVEEGGGEDTYGAIEAKTIKSYVDSQGLVVYLPTFTSCKMLSYVDLPNCIFTSATNISAFKNTAPTLSVSLPNLTQTSSVFAGCSGIREINLPLLYQTKGNTFNGASNLISVSLPMMEYMLPSAEFANCTQLRDVFCPGVQYFGKSAFWNCTSLSEFSTFATYAYSSAFKGCSNLSKIYFFTTSCSNLDADVFSDTHENLSIYVPSQCVESFKTATGWSVYSNKIFALDQSYESKYIFNYEFYSNFPSPLTSIPRPNVEGIGQYAFIGCTSISEINLPNCKFIGWNAFDSYTRINSINLPVCEYIYGNNFNGAGTATFTSLELPQVKAIGQSCFQSCVNLTEVSLPNCRLIRSNCFRHCSNLTNLYIPNCVYIEASVGQGLPITSLNIPNCVYIGSSAFNNCSQLETIVLANCYRIEGGFYGCTNIRTLDLRNAKRVPEWYNVNTWSISSIYVPSSLYTAFQLASGWSNLSNVMISV